MFEANRHPIERDPVVRMLFGESQLFGHAGKGLPKVGRLVVSGFLSV
jgi:hypothetical protein